MCLPRFEEQILKALLRKYRRLKSNELYRV
nr:MAG TPA: hypothetical protein [Caudoviricetes sp.]